MIFYPICYYQYDTCDTSEVVCYAYERIDENGGTKCVALRFQYPYRFYVKVGGNSIKSIQNIIPHTLNITLAPIIEIKSSTHYLHEELRVLEVFARSKVDKQKMISKFKSKGYSVHDDDDKFTPTLKMLAIKNIPQYCWMSADIGSASNRITTFEHEFMGLSETLIKTEVQYPPPKSRIGSFDLEVHSMDELKFPDARRDPGNEIKMASYIDIRDGKPKEYLITNGPDLEAVWRHERLSDFTEEYINLITCENELELIRNLFELIKTSDPDIITGHNITGFDLKYIEERWRFCVMNSNLDVGVDIPNISRMLQHNTVSMPVKWNNAQIAVEGLYYSCPGRIWEDVMLISGRGHFGRLKDNKLNTIAEEVLGMSKNDISPKDMFWYFRLWNNRETCSSEEVDKAYKYALDKHNKQFKTLTDTPNIQLMNEMISVINGINQRGKKIPGITLKEFSKIDVKSRYLQLLEIYNSCVKDWNVEERHDLSMLDKISYLWWFVGMYCVQDSRIPYLAMEQRGIIPILREQSAIFSTDIMDILMKGQVSTVNKSQYKYCRNDGTMVDFGNQGGPIEPFEYEGGFVGKGDPGLKIQDYDSVIIVLDFASLYPTAMIGHNICITTWVPENLRVNGHDSIWTRYKHKIIPNLEKYTKLLENPQLSELERKKYAKYVDDLNVIINTPEEDKCKAICNIYEINNEKVGKVNVHWFLKGCVKEGVLPNMLWEQFNFRKDIKEKMTDELKATCYPMYQTYDAQQLGSKVIMNSAYGGLGAKPNKLANFAAAEVTCYIGRSGITKVNEKVDSMPGNSVEYNDTDSAMIRLANITERFDRDPTRIWDYCKDLAKELSSIFPPPMSMEPENIFLSFFLKAPKSYCAIKWDKDSTDLRTYTWDYIKMHGLLYIKGLAPVRRDKCRAVRNLIESILFGILMRIPCSVLTAKMERLIMNIWNLKKGIKNYDAVSRELSYNFGVTTKATEADGESRALMANWIRIYQNKYGTKPTPGERYDLIVAEDPNMKVYKETKSAGKMVTIDWFKDESRTIDVVHYITVLGNPGNVVELLNIAYGNEQVPRKCIDNWYLPKLRRTGTLYG